MVCYCCSFYGFGGDDTVSVGLSRLSASALNMFRSVHSEHPLRDSVASVVQDLIPGCLISELNFLRWITSSSQ